MGNRKKALFALLAIGTQVLTACSSGTGIPALDRDLAETDKWPGDRSQLENLDSQSVRFLVTNDNADYYAAASADGQTACLFKFVQGEDSAAGGCGGAGGADAIVEVTAPGTKMMLVRAGSDISHWEDEGWTKIHENVLVF
ncbi:hypothetical protein RN04_01250 [Arthrobacter sp. W1]|nr:hypothetical protein RN04_01250 [Arthrobacter sp. W1]